jgi:hypothetical protein
MRRCQLFGGCRRHRERIVLRETASLLLFLGSLAQQVALKTTGERAIDQFAAQGYAISSSLTIEPVLYTRALSGVQGGGWAPGHIGLRPNPKGLYGPEHYLIHELAHEAVFQTCGVVDPARNEALTLLLTGELHSPLIEQGTDSQTTAVAEMRALWEVANNRAQISPPAERALRRVVAPYAAAPHKPCVLPEPLEATLRGPAVAASADTLVVSLLSGRVLFERGDVNTRRPLGSLLKIVHAGASQGPLSADVLEALARSDESLLAATTNLDADRLKLLTTTISTNASAPRNAKSSMGFANAGDYPYQGSLHEIALALRAAILVKGRQSWDPLVALTQDPAHTLHAGPQALRELLRSHRAWAKTGTLSLSDGTPMGGLLAFVWPQPNPTLLAVFSRSGVRGAHVLDTEVPAVRELFQLLQPAEREASSSIMTALPSQSFSVAAPREGACPELPLPSGDRSTLCGAIEVTTHAPGALPQRFFHGVLRDSTGHPLLVTDPYTFSNYVGIKEAGNVPPPVRDTIEAIAAWDATMATHGHPTGSLCDTTHCMVQMGWQRSAIPQVPRPQLTLLPSAFEIFRRITRLDSTRWIEFSLDRSEPWRREKDLKSLLRVFHLNAAVPPQRVRSKSGDISFQVLTDQGPQLISCDRFMTLLDLPSCPATLTVSPDGDLVILTGTTIGHGRGFSVQRAVDSCGSSDRCNALVLLEDLLEVPIMKAF